MKALPPLSFMKAIKFCFYRIFNINGRARRSEFWNFSLLYVIYLISFILFIQFTNIKIENRGIDGMLIFIKVFLSFLLNLMVIPLFTAMIRRLHDIGKGGETIILVLIPIIGFIIFILYLVKDSDKQTNRFGPSPKYYDNLEDALSNIENNNQVFMLQPIRPQINYNQNIPSQFNNNNNNQMYQNSQSFQFANSRMQLNSSQIIYNPQGSQLVNPPLNQSMNNFIIVEKKIPPQVQNLNNEPGIYQNIY